MIHRAMRNRYPASLEARLRVFIIFGVRTNSTELDAGIDIKHERDLAVNLRGHFAVLGPYYLTSQYLNPVSPVCPGAGGQAKVQVEAAMKV